MKNQKVGLEERFEALPMRKQLVISIPAVLVGMYVAVGFLRLLSVVTNMHPPMPIPALDWWWMWCF